MKICNGPECSRPSVTNGLCGTHYAQYRRGKDLTVIRKDKRSRPDEEYVAEVANRVNGRPITVTGKCVGPECERDAQVMTPLPLCKGHYQQQNKGQELRPLVIKSPRQPVDATERRCNVCCRIKSRDEFYTRTNGNPQTECKYCAGKRARITRLIRDGLHDEAQALEAVWTAYVRVVNKEWTWR